MLVCPNNPALPSPWLPRPGSAGWPAFPGLRWQQEEEVLDQGGLQHAPEEGTREKVTQHPTLLHILHF